MADSKGEDLMRKAEAKSKSFSLFNSAGKYEESAELYSNAAAQFKISKNWDRAGDAYLQAAEMSKLAKNESEITEYYTQAAQAYRKVNPEEALRVFNLAAALHMEQNRFSTAAKIYKSIGELCEEDRNYSGAIEAYTHAADCYIAEDSNTSANQMLLKVAHYTAIQEDFKRAIELYEQVALACLDSNLLSWGAKEHYFKAMLCHLAIAAKAGSGSVSWMDEAESAWDKYKGNYPAIEGSRECKLIDQLLASMNEGDLEKLQDAIVDYDTFSKLDDWKASILLQLKNALKAPPTLDATDLS